MNTEGTKWRPILGPNVNTSPKDRLRQILYIEAENEISLLIGAASHFDMSQLLKSENSGLPEETADEMNDQISTTSMCLSELRIGRLSPVEIASDNCSAPDVPIESLPPELLAYIFQSYVDLNCNLVSLALVCHKWRSTALQTRALWRFILVVDVVWDPRQQIINASIPGVDGRFNMLGRKQVCASQEQLINAIERAGSAALDVTVDFTGAITRTRPSMNVHAIQMCLSVFGDQGIIAKTAKLSISSLPDMPDSCPAWSKLCIPPYPLLDTFSCASIGHRWIPFISQMLSSSPKLTSAELPPSLQDVLKESQIWSNLQCFCSMGGQFWRNPLTPETPTDIILSKCLSIEKIVLSLIPWPNINTATISYVKLRYAVLRGEIQFMVRLRAPLLTFLSLYELPSYDGQQSESLHIELPNLKILSVDTANPSWIYRSNLPSLVSLSMNLTRGGYLSTHFFVPNGLPTVLDVKIEYLASDLAIIWALESFQNAETVKIVPVGQQLTLGRLTSQTLVRRLFSPEPFTLVPKAWYIQLGNAQTKVEGSMSVLEPLLRALVEDRKERGTPLQSINAHWAGLTSVVEYA